MAEAGLERPFIGFGSMEMMITSRPMPKRPKKKATRGRYMAKPPTFSVFWVFWPRWRLQVGDLGMGE